jgi:hypothetical protein
LQGGETEKYGQQKASLQIIGAEENQEASCERVKQAKTSRIKSIGK